MKTEDKHLEFRLKCQKQNEEDIKRLSEQVKYEVYTEYPELVDKIMIKIYHLVLGEEHKTYIVINDLDGEVLSRYKVIFEEDWELNKFSFLHRTSFNQDYRMIIRKLKLKNIQKNL